MLSIDKVNIKHKMFIFISAKFDLLDNIPALEHYLHLI